MKKLSKLLATVGCLLSVASFTGCGGSKESVEFTYNGRTYETFEMIPMSAVVFETTYKVKEGKDDYATYKQSSYSIRDSKNTYSYGEDYEITFAGSYCTFFNYRIGEGKYTFDLTFTHEGEEKTFDFKFEVFDAFEYASSKIAKKIVANNDKDPDLGYCDSYSTNGFGSLFMVDNEKDSSLEIFTMYSSGGSTAMINININSDSTFELEYMYDYNGSTEAYGSGTYYNNSIKLSTASTPFSSFSGSSKSTHESMSASLLVIALSSLHAYAKGEFSDLVVLSVPFMLGFESFY